MELNSLPIVSQSSVATWFLIKRNKKCCDRFLNSRGLGVEDGAWRCKRFDDGANLGLQDDGVNPAQDASVDVTNRT
jgi:hypothetical protein